MKHLPLRLFLATAVALSLAAAEDLDLVRTPFGTKPRACVLEVRGGSTAEDALSSYEVPPICSEPRFRTAPTRQLGEYSDVPREVIELLNVTRLTPPQMITSISNR